MRQRPTGSLVGLLLTGLAEWNRTTDAQEPVRTYVNLATKIGILCENVVFEILDLHRFYELSQRAVSKFDPQAQDFGIPWELKSVSIYPGDEEDLIADFLDDVLPRYSLILLVSIMERFFGRIRQEAHWTAAHKKKGFGLPMPPWFDRSDVDQIWTPLAAGYVETKAARNLLVHSGGVVDDHYVRQSGPLARAKPGEKYPLSDEYFRQSYSCCQEFVDEIELRWFYYTPWASPISELFNDKPSIRGDQG